MKKLLSKNIIKQNMKNNWKLWVILTGILCFFIVIVTTVLKGNIDNLAEQHAKQQQIQSMVPGYTPIPFRFADVILAIYERMFFGIMGMSYILLLIYIIAVGNKLVASEIDRGTMSFTLNTPTTRKQIIFSKALFFIGSITVMILAITLSGIIICAVLNIGIDYGKLWLVAFGYWLFSFALSSIAFAASCWFNKSGHSLLIGAGIPVLFFLFSTLASIEKTFEFLKYLSLNTLYNTENILALTNFIPQFITLFVIGIVLYFIGIRKFLEKDLPL